MTKRLGLREIDTAGAASGNVPTYNATSDQLEYAPAAGALTVQDENGNVATAVTRLDFQGPGVTATAGTGEVVVTIPGSTGSGGKTAALKYAGTLSVGIGATRLYNDSGSAWAITSVRATVETPPTGGTVVVDVNISGTTIFTTQANRPTITAGNNTSGKNTSMDIATVPDGSYLTVDVDVATAPAANLTVQIGVS